MVSISGQDDWSKEQKDIMQSSMWVKRVMKEQLGTHCKSLNFVEGGSYLSSNGWGQIKIFHWYLCSAAANSKALSHMSFENELLFFFPLDVFWTSYKGAFFPEDTLIKVTPLS